MEVGSVTVWRVHDVLIVVLDQTVEPDLVRLAVDRGWALLRTSTVREAIRELRVRRVDVAVVQVAVLIERAVELIQLLREHWNRVPIVAVARSHDERLERAVRSAGADCYLPSPDADAIEQAVDSLATRNGLVSGPDDSAVIQLPGDEGEQEGIGRDFGRQAL